jgi:hypothetical protein
MAGFWYRLWEDKTGEQVAQVCYYFDGQRKPLWSDYSVKKSKVSKVGRVMGCLEQVYVHSDRGHPLLLQTFSGGVHLPDAIKKLHNQIDKILPQHVNRISVFDGGANSVDFYETFKDNTYFICILDNNQYKQDLSDMTIIERNQNNDGAIYIEAEKTLKNSKNKKLYRARIAVYKKPHTERHIAFVTNISRGNLTAESVVEMYYKRWPSQEEQFRDMNGGAHLSTNYGFGKTHVINLVIQNKKRELDRQIKFKKENIKNLSDKISILETHKQQIRRQSKKQEYQTKIKQIEKKIGELPGKKQVKTLLKELKQLYITLEQNQTEMIKNELKIKAAIEKLQAQKKRQKFLYEKHKAEFTRIKDKELVYENDVELDQLLGSYKIAFANLCAYVLKEYFPGLTLSLEKLINKVFKRPGKLIIKGSKREVMIYLNRKDANMSNFITKACEIINGKLIRQYDNTLLKLVPVYK